LPCLFGGQSVPPYLRDPGQDQATGRCRPHGRRTAGRARRLGTQVAFRSHGKCS